MTVTLDGVSFTYPGSTQAALSDIGLSFSPGGITLVTGPLGSGASTLLLLIAGLAPHLTAGTRLGSVTTLGADPGSPEGRRALAGRIGLLLPTPWTQLSGMAGTVADEVAFGPANHGWDRARIDAAVTDALSRTAAEHLAGRDPATLSGGELQRVMLAALIATEPEVYLLDEPTLELDPAGARLLYDLMEGLARTATVILASTDVDRAAERAARVILLEHGRCIADGTVPAVLGSDQAVALRACTTVTGIFAAAGWTGRHPVTVSQAVAMVSP